MQDRGLARLQIVVLTPTRTVTGKSDKNSGTIAPWSYAQASALLALL
jgi:hypothetical protein